MTSDVTSMCSPPAQPVGSVYIRILVRKGFDQQSAKIVGVDDLGSQITSEQNIFQTFRHT